MSKPRAAFLLLVVLLFLALPFAAAHALAQTAPPTETPAPTSTPVSLAPPGDVRDWADWLAALWQQNGLWTIGIVAVGIAAVFAAAYLSGVLERVKDKGKADTEKIGQPRPPADPLAEATHAYLEWFKSYHSRFSFRGLEDVAGARPPEFNKAYISLRLSTSGERAEMRRGKSEEAAGLIREGAGEITLAEALRRWPRLALVGAAGSGKSTLLQWAGVTAARAQLAHEALSPEQRALIESVGQPLPVLIALRDFVRFCHNPQSLREINPATLVEFISHHHAGRVFDLPAGFFQHHLRHGCLLLLDGVDEVNPADRVKVREAVEGLVTSYGTQHNRYLLSSRTVAYKGEVEFADFEKLDVQPLSREQRDELARYWCESVYAPGEAEPNAAALSDSIDHSDDNVRDLARTPLMAAIFVLVYFHNQRTLPRQRAEFYHRAARVLASEKQHKTDAPDYPQWERLTTETRIDRLKHIAYELYRRGQNAATAEELLEWTVAGPPEYPGGPAEAREFFIAAANRSGLLEERSGQFGFFTHKTFQEYLAGLYLAEELEDDWAATLTGRLLDDNWLEATRLAAGSLAYLHAGKANKFIKLLSDLGGNDAERTVALERAALAQADFPPDRAQANRADLITRLQSGLVNLQLEPTLRRPLGLALGAVGDPRFSPTLISGINVIVPEPVSILSGTFRMGTSNAEAENLKAQDAESWDDEKPQHAVFVFEFTIGKYPITNAEYRLFWEAKGYENKDYWSDDGWRWRAGKLDADLSIYSEETRKNVAGWLAGRPVEKRHQPFFWDDPKWNAPNLPVVGVTWYEAEAYCKWLRAMTGERYRLPTEAEWEKAARYTPLSLGGRGAGGEGRLWPWGDEWDPNKCNSEESKFGETTSAGMYPDGTYPDGPLDMVGNVWEWCADWWQADVYTQRGREGKEVRDPTGPTSGSARVVRGGSWNINRGDCRAASRNRNDPAYFLNDIGFRVARSPVSRS